MKDLHPSNARLQLLSPGKVSVFIVSKDSILIFQKNSV